MIAKELLQKRRPRRVHTIYAVSATSKQRKNEAVVEFGGSLMLARWKRNANRTSASGGYLGDGLS